MDEEKWCEHSASLPRLLRDWLWLLGVGDLGGVDGFQFASV